MIRPDEYEKIVAEHYRKQGYNVRRTPDSNDYGVDVFAEKDDEKIAVQAKMYGDTTRRINRTMVMELYGAAAYFDCNKAVIATNGHLLDTAREVAKKLRVEIVKIPAYGYLPTVSEDSSEDEGGNDEDGEDINEFENDLTFDLIWEKHVMPLQGRVLTRSNRKSNRITKVDWAGVERVTSNGKPRLIHIEIFKKTVNYLLRHGQISRSVINQEYAHRASSGIVLILGSTDIFEHLTRPEGLRLKKR